MPGAFKERKKFKTIHGKRMAYIEEDSAEAIGTAIADWLP